VEEQVDAGHGVDVVVGGVLVVSLDLVLVVGVQLEPRGARVDRDLHDLPAVRLASSRMILKRHLHRRFDGFGPARGDVDASQALGQPVGFQRFHQGLSRRRGPGRHHVRAVGGDFGDPLRNAGAAVADVADDGTACGVPPPSRISCVAFTKLTRAAVTWDASI